MLKIRQEYLDKIQAFRQTDYYRKALEHGWQESGDTSVYCFEKVKGEFIYWMSSVYCGLGKDDSKYDEFDFSRVYVTKNSNEDGEYYGEVFEGMFQDALTCI